MLTNEEQVVLDGLAFEVMIAGVEAGVYIN
jgi:hypothetical protein